MSSTNAVQDVVETELERVRSALSQLDPEDYDTWIRAGMCVKDGLADAGFEIWDSWSAEASNYNASAAKSSWKSFKPGGVTINSLFFDAKAAGWKDTTKYTPPSKEQVAARKAKRAAELKEALAAEAKMHADAAAKAQAIWDAATPATDHPYLQRKGVLAHGLRIGKWERVDAETGELILVTTNGLLIPIRDRNKKVWSVQCIQPEEGRLKLYLKGGAKSGHFFSIGSKPLQRNSRSAFVLVEGYATGASVHECTGHLVLVCFDRSNLITVAKTLRERQPDSVIIFAADNDAKPDTTDNPGFSDAVKAARAVDGLVALPPPGDFNDLHQKSGAGSVCECIESAYPPKEPLKNVNQKFTTLGVIPLGRRANKYAFWRCDFKTIEILSAAELSTPHGLQRLAHQNTWDNWADGNFKARVASDNLINYCGEIGEMNLSLVPRREASAEEVREQYLKSCVRSDGLPGVHVVVELLLLQKEWNGVIFFDEHASRPAISKKPPCGGDAGFFTEDHALQLKNYLAEKFAIDISILRVLEVVNTLAFQNKRHPIRDYLNSLEWDGIPRLDTWLIDYAGCSDTAYARAVSTKTLISAVARAFKPGVKVDTTLILEGPQGAKKSSLIMALMPQTGWFAEDLGGPIGHKDSLQGLAGKWIIELPELASVKKGAIDDVKSFISRTSDNYRPSYGRTSKDYPRQCIFMGTVNPDGDGRWINHATGGRRFWPLAVNYCNVKGVAAIRDLLWAEATQRYKAGEPHWLTVEEELEAQQEQSARMQSNPWEIHVERYTTRKTKVVIADIFAQVMERPMTKRDKGEMQAIAQALKSMGWSASREGKERTRCWIPGACDEAPI